VGLMWPVLVLSATATADPSARPGVPCLDMVQSFAASPSAVPDALQTAADALAPPAPPARVPAPVPAPAGNDVETRSRSRPRWQLGLGRRRLGRRLAWWTGMAGSARTVRRRVLGAPCRMAVGAARSLGLLTPANRPSRRAPDAIRWFEESLRSVSRYTGTQTSTSRPRSPRYGVRCVGMWTRNPVRAKRVSGAPHVLDASTRM
jgi:hypothetical protein